MQIIFAPDGTPTEVTRLNAHDLIRSNGYSWFAPEASVLTALEPAETPEPETPEPEAADATQEEALQEDTPPGIDVNDTPLDQIVFAMVGTSDIPKYLEGFSTEALRVMAETRYAAKLHHKSSKETLIAKIVGLEAEKTSKESTAQE